MFILLTWCFIIFIIMSSWRMIINLSILDQIVFIITCPLEGRLFIMFIIMCLLKDDVCAFISFRSRGVYFSNVFYFRIWSVVVEFIIMNPLEGTDIYHCICYCVSSWKSWYSFLYFIIIFPIEGSYSFLFLFLFLFLIRKHYSIMSDSMLLLNREYYCHCFFTDIFF